MGKALKDLPPEQQRMFATPAGFARFFLGLKPYPNQESVLNDVAPNGSRVSYCCGNEVGKTSLVVTTAILWHLTVFPPIDGNGGVISTAGAWRQVTGQLVPALKRFEHKFPRWDFNNAEIKCNGVPIYQGFSANNQWTSQGFHGSPTSPLLAIVDEAGAVDDQIFFALEDRCNPQRFLLTGSPAEPMGTFYNSRSRLASFYEQHSMSQIDCLKDFGGHIEKTTVLRTIGKYDPDGLKNIPALDGVDVANVEQASRVTLTRADWAKIQSQCRHPWVLSRVFAAFGDAVQNAVLSLRDYNQAIESAPAFQPGERHVFCDFAAGGDENVCAVRWGNKVWIEKAWRERDTMKACAEFVRIFTKLKNEIGLQAHEIECDNDGLGKPMVDAIKEAGWAVLQFHGATPPHADQNYFNRVSEVWCGGADLIRRYKFILPIDEELRAQLITRKAQQRFNAEKKSKMAIEPKKELLARNLPSPDRADAVLGAMAPLPVLASRSLTDAPKPFQDWADQSEMRIDDSILRGIDAGS